MALNMPGGTAFNNAGACEIKKLAMYAVVLSGVALFIQWMELIERFTQ